MEKVSRWTPILWDIPVLQVAVASLSAQDTGLQASARAWRCERDVVS